MSSLFQLHEFLLNQNYTYVGTLGGDSVLSLRSYLSFTCCWRQPTSLECLCYCFSFQALTTFLWEMMCGTALTIGTRRICQKNGNTFSLSVDLNQSTPSSLNLKRKKLLWLKDLAQNNNFLLYCSATFIQNDKINIMKYQIIVFSVPFKSYCFVIGWPAIFCVSMAFLCCLSNWFHLVGFDCIESRPLKIPNKQTIPLKG